VNQSSLEEPTQKNLMSYEVCYRVSSILLKKSLFLMKYEV
jgi:hypothetical protein